MFNVTSMSQNILHIILYNGPGAVGSKMPVIVAAIHIIMAITKALSQPISYNALNAKSHTNPAAIAAQKPLPRRKYVIL